MLALALTLSLAGPAAASTEGSYSCEQGLRLVDNALRQVVHDLPAARLAGAYKQRDRLVHHCRRGNFDEAAEIVADLLKTMERYSRRN